MKNDLSKDIKEIKEVVNNLKESMSKLSFNQLKTDEKLEFLSKLWVKQLEMDEKINFLVDQC